MSMTPTTILDLIAPQFAADADKTSFLTLAKIQTSATFYGAKYNMAVALRAAHMLTLRDRAQSTQGAGGQITSMREGDLAVSYSAASSGGSGDLSQTSYGMQLQGLKKGGGAFLGVTGGLDDGS